MIFEDHNNESLKTQIQNFKDLTIYKYCLINEFEDDDKDIHSEVLHEG